MKHAAKAAPKALLLIISNPVNSTVPIAAEVLSRLITAFSLKEMNVLY